MSPRRAWLPFMTLLKSSAGVWVALALTCGAILARAPLPAWLIVVLSGLAGTLVTSIWVTRRTRRLLALAESAREMIPGELGRRSGRAAPLPGLGAPELEPLRGALHELGQQIDTQVRELAKKTINLEAIIDALDEPILATDSAERVILWNRSAESIFGVEPGGLLGKSFQELFTQELLQRMHDSARGGALRRERVALTTTLGRRIFQVSAAPVPVAWGAGVFGAVMLLRDVTELDQAVQVKSDFVANASHELRTPVAAIRGAAETLESIGPDDPAMVARLVAMVRTHAENLEEMVRDLLDLSRLESPETTGRVDRIDLERVEDRLRTLFGDACQERGIGLVFEFDGDIEGMRCDPDLLMLILRNLVENAARFVRDATPIEIRGSLMEAEVEAGASSEGDGGSPLAHRTRGAVRFEVTDHGLGIPIGQQERVFERYYQVEPSRPDVDKSSGREARSRPRRGTGLGLAIVKHAARRLGGRVGLHSVWQEGTTVWVEFPVSFTPGADHSAGVPDLSAP